MCVAAQGPRHAIRDQGEQYDLELHRPEEVSGGRPCLVRPLSERICEARSVAIARVAAEPRKEERRLATFPLRETRRALLATAEFRQLDSCTAIRGLQHRDLCPDAIEPHETV